MRHLRTVLALAAIAALTTTPVFGQSGPVVAWAEADQPGTDSVYTAARRALQQRDYRRAASLFAQVHGRNPKAPIAAEALYWRSFALYRVGGGTNLKAALASLAQLDRDFPRYSAAGDAGELRVLVCGVLAADGDEDCASEVRRVADVPTTAAAASAGGRSTSGRARATQPRECPDEDEDERVAALNALLQMNADQALPILERVLARRDQCSVTLRRKAVFLVSQKRDDKAVELLTSAIRSDPDAEVREQAVFWLGQTGSDRAVDVLQEILRNEKDDEVLKKAVFSLSQHRSARSGAILRELAQRSSAPVELRSEAIFWLAQGKGGRENLTLLSQLYTQVSQEELKDKIIFSVSQIGGGNAGQWLLDLAMNAREDTEMRKKALFWIGQGRGLPPADLVGLYDRLTDRELREQLIFVYSQRKDTAFADKLIDIAKNDKDRELRTKAIFWLSQSRDARVLKFLEDLVNK